MSDVRVRDHDCDLPIGKRIRRFIEAEIRDYDWDDWLSERVIGASEMKRFLDAGEAALDERSNDMANMVYAVVRRPYGNYNNEDEEKLLRMFATQKEADEYVTSQVALFRPTWVRNRNDCDEYEYGMIDTDTVISKVEFPQYVIRPFYIEEQE